MSKNLKIWLEFFLIFVIFPTLLIFKILPKSALYLGFLLIFFWAFYILRNERFLTKFNPKFLILILARFLIFGAILCVFALNLGKFNLELPKNHTKFWLILIFIYPLVSAFTQEFIYRKFFFYSYSEILRSLIIPINALLFAYLHLLYIGYLAFLLTLVGGTLFALTYKRTNSLILCAIEHGIYGDLVFTIGLGRYFYQV